MVSEQLGVASVERYFHPQALQERGLESSVIIWIKLYTCWLSPFQLLLHLSYHGFLMAPIAFIPTQYDSQSFSLFLPLLQFMIHNYP